MVDLVLARYLGDWSSSLSRSIEGSELCISGDRNSLAMVWKSRKSVGPVAE